MIEYNKSNHKIYLLKYHFVIVTKYRKGLFSSQKTIDLFKQICEDISDRYDIEFETIGFDKNHVHLLICSVPIYSPSKILKILKGITAREMFLRDPELKKFLWGSELWSDGGFISTVGEGANADIIRNYFQKQGESDKQLKLFEFVDAP